MNCELMLTYDTPALWQTGSRNLTGQKTLPTIWGTYIKLVNKYQISAINICWEKCAYMLNVYKSQLSRQTGSRNLTGQKNASHKMGYLYEACDELSDFCHQYLLRKMRRNMSIYVQCVEKSTNWQTGSRNLMGPKTLPRIWGTNMKLVTKYQIHVINSCWEKCDEKCAYMFNVYKNQLSRQTGSRNLTGPKMLPTIWHTYMKLVTKYQISAIDSCWEKWDENEEELF
jgi:hypothetical protein